MKMLNPAYPLASESIHSRRFDPSLGLRLRTAASGRSTVCLHTD